MVDLKDVLKHFGTLFACRLTPLEARPQIHLKTFKNSCGCNLVHHTWCLMWDMNSTHTCPESFLSSRQVAQFLKILLLPHCVTIRKCSLQYAKDEQDVKYRIIIGVHILVIYKVKRCKDGGCTLIIQLDWDAEM